MKVSWKKSAGATGYKLSYRATGGKSSYTVRNLKTGKIYYIGVRSYVKKGGKRYDGVSSVPQQVKTGQSKQAK